MYKISYKSIIRTNADGSVSGIPEDSTNTDYQQFIKDVAEQGIGIVEGPNVIEPDYAALRTQEYPSFADQFDKIYHEGVDAWKAEIQAIKDRYPKTITGGTTIAEVPDWVQEAADNWTFNKQLREYVVAVERLEQYVLAEGREALTEEVPQLQPLFLDTDVEVYDDRTGNRVYVERIETIEVRSAIDPLPATIETIETNIETGETTTSVVPNPAIVRDTEERAAAQAVIDATPQAIIDSLS